ncbi:MAG TPA: cation diffusion facilitator family transporter [Actinomycetales bacterium]|nr:cation diffusion facilitator family transporter [Actinomycetales bacterium]
MTGTPGQRARQHHHDDHLVGTTNRSRLALVLAITVAVLLVEVVGAALSGSLALLADAAHMLTDVGGLLLALVAAALSLRPPSDSRTWGWRRAEVVAAAFQAAVLLAVGGFVVVESIRRLVSPPEVQSGAMVVFGVVGLLGNVVGIAVLSGSRGDNLNMRAAFLEVVNDALGSVAVLVAAVVIAVSGWTRADAVASLVIAALIVPRTVGLLRESVDVLLEATPKGLDLSDVREHVLAMPHVHEVHDLHASQVATGLPVLTAHVVVDDGCFHDGHLRTLLDDLQACLAEDFDVEHSTFQFEAAGHVGHEHAAHS